LGKPITAHDAGLTDAPASVVNPSWQADPIRKLIQLNDAGLDPTRPVVNASLFSMAALVVPDHLTSTISPTQQTSPDKILHTSADISRLGGMANLFYTASQKYGGQQVRTPLTAYLAHHVTPLLQARAADHPERRAIFTSAAQLTLLLADMCADSGHDRNAQHYQQVAAQLALHAGDRATLAIALRTMATHAYDLGHHGPTVLNLIKQAAVHAHHAPPAVQAYVQAHLAAVQAHHDRRAALKALARAESLHAQADTAPNPFATYSPGALYFQSARTLATLGDGAGAIRALATSQRLRTSAEHRATVLAGADLAELHLNLGHLDRAISHTQTFLKAYPTLNSTRAARRLKALHARLRPYQRHPQISALLTSLTLPNH